MYTNAVVFVLIFRVEQLSNYLHLSENDSFPLIVETAMHWSTLKCCLENFKTVVQSTVKIK